MNNVCSECGVNTLMLGRHVPGCKLGPADDTFDKFLKDTEEAEAANDGLAVLGRSLTEAVAERTVKLIEVVIVPELVAAGLPEDGEDVQMLREVAHQVAIAATAVSIQVMTEQGLLDDQKVLELARSLRGGPGNPEDFKL